MVVLVITIAILASAVSAAPKCSTRPKHQCDSPECFAFASEIVKGINRSVNPCEDFFGYTCGLLQKYDYVIEDDQTAQSEFIKTANQIETRIRDLLEAQADEGNPPLKIGKQMYSACLDTNKPENIQALRQLLDEFGGWPLLVGDQWEANNNFYHFSDLVPFYTKLFTHISEGVLFNFKVMSDSRNNTRPMATFLQPRLQIKVNLTAEEEVKLETGILILAKIFGIPFDEASARKDCKGIFKVNDEIRKIPVSRDELQAFTTLTVGEFSKMIPNINWIEFLNAVFDKVKTWTEADEIGVVGVPYFEQIAKVLSNGVFTTRGLINYEIMNIVSKTNQDYSLLPDTSNFLSPYEFMSEVNTQYPRIAIPRWKTCVNQMNKWLKFALAKKYGDVYTNAAATRVKAKEIAENIVQVFHRRLESIEWLDEESRKAAIEKLENMRGYYLFPTWSFGVDNITDYYKNLESSNVHVKNTWTVNKFLTGKTLRTIVEPSGKDRETFDNVFPLDVNSIYRVTENSMYILLGMAQAPMFNVGRLRVMNFATLGAVIGHEITHGYDLKGQRFDKHGNLQSWMSENSNKEFEKRKKCFIDQYSNYSLTDSDLPGTNGVKVNGLITLNENIADNGGIRHAYEAYWKWVQDKGIEVLPDALQGYSLDEVFFLSYAHSWCLKYGPSKDLERNVANNEHSPAKFRVMGTLSNFEAFASAFGCKTGEPMNRGNQRCRLW